jgi:hypothetical protein
MKNSKSYEFKPFFHENSIYTYVKIIFFTLKFGEKKIQLKKFSKLLSPIIPSFSSWGWPFD